MKQCRRCEETLGIEYFNFRNKNKGILSSFCKNCTRMYVRTHYTLNREYYLTKARRRNQIIVKELKSYIHTYLKNHSCQDCGESDIVVLEFDHLRDKKFDISSAVKVKYSLARLRQEIEKCEVVCANCHRRRTANRLALHKYKPR